MVLPGIVDVRTQHPVASDRRADRFFRDSVAAAFGGRRRSWPSTTRHPLVAGGGTVSAELRESRAATEADSAIDYAVSLAISGRMDDPVAELAAMVDAGVSTAKAFMVFDFRLDDVRLFEALGVPGGAAGCSRSTARIRCSSMPRRFSVAPW